MNEKVMLTLIKSLRVSIDAQKQLIEVLLDQNAHRTLDLESLSCQLAAMRALLFEAEESS